MSSCGLAQRARTLGDLKQQRAAIYHVSNGIMGDVSQTLRKCAMKYVSGALVGHPGDSKVYV